MRVSATELSPQGAAGHTLQSSLGRASTAPRVPAGSASGTDTISGPTSRVCQGLFLSDLTRVWQWRKAQVPDRRRPPHWLKGRRMCTRTNLPAWPSSSSTQIPLQGPCKSQPRREPRCEVREQLWLEVVLVEGCGRGARLQPLDVAGVTEQAVLQGVAAVPVFIIELHTTVLAVVTLHMVVSVHGHHTDGLI